MKKIYFTRHGKTELNKLDLVCGSTDAPLAPEGHQQAIELGKMIKQKLDNGEIEKLDGIISSPYIRALDTAKHIAEYTGHQEIQIDRRVREQDFGKYEQTPRSGEEYIHDKTQFCHTFSGGESRCFCAQRIYNFLDEMKEREGTYLVVAHNGILRVVRSYFEDMDNDDFLNWTIDNCELLCYEFK
jgi:probable phosphoglycerate mutase